MFVYPISSSLRAIPEETVADVGLDALLEGQCSIISGRNQIVAWLPRMLTRQRSVSIAGDTRRKTPRS